MHSDLKYILAFHKIFKINLNNYFMQLYERYGSFQEAWFNLDFSPQIGIPKKYRGQFLQMKKTIVPQELEEEYYRSGINVLTRLDENYPDSLLQISDVPCILYYCGDISLLQQNALAVVGSRRATTYGLKQARLMAGELSQNGLVIVSGMARGIDAAAHRGALEKNGGTIAVLGSGLDRPYPRENIKLFQEISEKGLVISEYPLDTEPVGYNFPIRNRIISGLSQGVFVVEARARSGSLITCDLALEQGKEVFALPGPVTSPNSIGPLRLIQYGAKLVIYPQDILEELGYEYQATIFHKQKEIIKEIGEKDKAVYNLISWEPVNIEFILEKNIQNQEEVLRVLLELELKGLIKQLPGKYYVRV
ncbi:MAG TPA: DNA-protecting protein DprA [Clostridia bacterium]|nr:DNA-processing protein DprA [Clostridia bacterium]HHY06209.1 DNA-protecting protein DprA [Clostridia bacterium]